MLIRHVLDPAACGDEGLLCCADAMGIREAEGTDIRHECVLIGDSAAERRAWGFDIRTTDRVTPRRIAGRSPLLRSICRLDAARSSRSEQRPDIIQSWSLDAASLARSLYPSGPDAPARVAVIPRTPLDRPTRDAAPDSDLATGREIFAALDDTARGAIAPLISLAGSREADRWLPTIRSLEPPIFDRALGASVFPPRSETRAALGLAPNETVIGVLADPPRAADAERAMFTAGVLFAAGRRSTWLIRRGARHERRAAEYLRSHAHRWGMALADITLPELIAASDLCVIDAVPQHDGLPLATCGPTAIAVTLAAGIPVVASPGAASPRDQMPIAFASIPALGRTAVPIALLLESSAARSDLAAAARTWVAQARARNGFASTLASIWLEAANIPSSEPFLAAVK